MSGRTFYFFMFGIVIGLVLAEYMGHTEYREYVKRLPETQTNEGG